MLSLFLTTESCAAARLILMQDIYALWAEMAFAGAKPLVALQQHTALIFLLHVFILHH